jgi:hypothetical protein
VYNVVKHALGLPNATTMSLQCGEWNEDRQTVSKARTSQ